MGKKEKFDVIQQVSEKKIWETTDGKHFEDMDAAYDHQEELNFRLWLEKEGVGSGGVWSADMIADTILEYWKVEPKHEA